MAVNEARERVPGVYHQMQELFLEYVCQTHKISKYNITVIMLQLITLHTMKVIFKNLSYSPKC